MGLITYLFQALINLRIMDTPETNSPEQAPRKGWGRVITVLVVLAILAGAAYVYFQSDLLDGVSDPANQSAGAVVATVNGTEITQAEVDERIERNQSTLLSQGIDATNPDTRSDLEDQVLEQLINEELVLAAAQAQGIVVTDTEVTAQMDAIKAQFESDAAFESQLAENGFTEATLAANLKRDLTIQRYIEQIAAADPIEISAEEVETAYATLAEQNEEIPPLEEIRDQIEAQLRQQQLAVVVASAVEELRTSADIVIEGEAEAESTN